MVSASLTHPGNYTNAAGEELMNKWEDITAVALINDILTNEYMQENTGVCFFVVAVGGRDIIVIRFPLMFYNVCGL